MAEPKKTVYHYTSKENAAKIRESGEIRPSSDGAYGGGKVYLTSKDPSVGKSEIARNNYDNPARGLWEKREAKGDVDVAIKLKIPESKLTVEDSNHRDIITHKGAIEVDKYK